MLDIPVKKRTLNLIAGRPGMGKSAFALSYASQLVNEGKNVLYISAQSDFNDAKESSVNSLSVLATKFMHIDIIEKRLEKINHDQIVFIDGIESISLGDMRGPFNPHVSDEDYNSIVVQRLLRMHYLYDNLTFFLIGGISATIEDRFSGYSYNPSDIKWRSALEDYLDMVITVYRMDFYGITIDEDGNDITNVMDIKIIKNRLGPIEEFKLKAG